MLTIKALHIIFVVSWFAGLFYLPRIFVNHAMVEDAATKERLAMMERKLYGFVTPIGLLAVGLGLWLWYRYPFFSGGWLHLKVTLVIFLIGYHLYCGKLMRDFAAGRNTRSHVWYRVFNEVPVVLLIAVVFLTVLKPF